MVTAQPGRATILTVAQPCRTCGIGLRHDTHDGRGTWHAALPAPRLPTRQDPAVQGSPRHRPVEPALTAAITSDTPLGVWAPLLRRTLPAFRRGHGAGNGRAASTPSHALGAPGI